MHLISSCYPHDYPQGKPILHPRMSLKNKAKNRLNRVLLLVESILGMPAKI